MAKHNNIDPTIGNFYHYCIVVDKLFDLKENEKLVIEVDGDLTKVRINDTFFIENYEIKHHKGSTKLNYSNVDFWNTIKNWIENFDSYSSSTKLILHTTSTSDKDLVNFDKKTKIEKLKIFTDWKEKTKNAEINNLFSIIFKSRTKLKNLLQKIQFESDQVKYNSVRDKIIEKHHTFFSIFKDNNEIKINAINYFMAEIIYSLKDNKNWEITFEHFRDIKNDFIYKNEIDNIKIEESDLIHNEDEKKEYKEELKSTPLYVQKLKDINLSENKIRRASKHKLRAIKFALRLTKNSFTYKTKLKKCDEIFIDKLDDIKSDFNFEENYDLNIENSKKVYDKSMKMKKICLIDEDKTESFRKGYWHILANDEDNKEMNWLIKDNKQ